MIDTDPGWAPAQSLAALTRSSLLVVVARAVEQRSYWHRAGPGHAFLSDDGWMPMTATEFSVEQVLKGSPTPNLALIEEGANPGTLACDGITYVFDDAPLTRDGGEYVLFLRQADSLGNNMWRMGFAPYLRFDVTGGVVKAEYALPGYSPEALLTFVSDVRAAE